VGAGEKSGRKPSPYPRVEWASRFLARLADLLVAGLFAYLVPTVGPLLAVFFVLLADALPNGQSPGKRLVGIKAVHVPTRTPCGPRQSVLRNLTVAVAVAFLVTEFNALLAWLALPILLFEAYSAATDALGLRLGDVLADTQVIDGKVPFATGVAGTPVRPRHSLPAAEVGKAADVRT
jgi:uncharacterized RDD family membrane protein YckC